MTSLEKAINLGYLFLTYKPKKKPSIHSPLSSACIGMFHFFQKSIFDPNTCTLKWAPIMGFVDVHQVNCPIWGWHNSFVPFRYFSKIFSFPQYCSVLHDTLMHKKPFANFISSLNILATCISFSTIWWYVSWFSNPSSFESSFTSNNVFVAGVLTLMIMYSPNYWIAPLMYSSIIISTVTSYVNLMSILRHTWLFPIVVSSSPSNFDYINFKIFLNNSASIWKTFRLTTYQTIVHCFP